MECKNCSSSQRTDYNYCPNCGAKVIRNRLTFKNLWIDLRERLFNYDNTFLKTFLHLFSKPEKVINGYVSGIRRRYLDPISYFGIALTLSGILVFLIKRFYMDDLRMDVFDTGTDEKVFRGVFEGAMDFQAFTFVVLIPMLAIVSWIILNKHKYIFSEHIVAVIYLLAHYTIFTFPISLLILSIAPATYTDYGVINVLIMLIYSLYAFKRIASYKLGPFLLRSLVFIFLFMAEYIFLSILTVLVLVFTGIVSLEDFRPK